MFLAQRESCCTTCSGHNFGYHCDYPDAASAGADGDDDSYSYYDVRGERKMTRLVILSGEDGWYQGAAGSH